MIDRNVLFRLTRAALAAIAIIWASAITPARARDPDVRKISVARVTDDLIFQVNVAGPRYPGTPGHRLMRDWLRLNLEKLDRHVVERTFPARLELITKDVTGHNFWGLPHPPEEMKHHGPYYLISCHWDTRPYADEGPDGGKDKLFYGANDGGSGVAMALAMARVIQGTPYADRFAFLFVDCEDSGVEDMEESWAVGSQFEAKNPPDWLREKLIMGINLDMVGANRMELHPESHSRKHHRDFVDRLWLYCDTVEPMYFYNNEIGEITDDHLPFIRAGFPYIDIVGFPYNDWHTIRDHLQAVDPMKLSRVGDAILGFLLREIDKESQKPE